VEVFSPKYLHIWTIGLISRQEYFPTVYRRSIFLGDYHQPALCHDATVSHFVVVSGDPLKALSLRTVSSLQ